MKSEGWVIKRDDGKYCANNFARFMWHDEICKAEIFISKNQCKYAIKCHSELKGCKPIKIEIREVEDE